MFSFKAFIVRWFAGTTQIAPFTKPQIMRILATSAAAAAQQCSGGENGRMCGLSWRLKDKWDGTQGAGQQMAAMEVVMANMIDFAKAPVTNETGGSSVGNPGGGSRRPPPLPPSLLWEATRGDEGGAWISTGVVLVVMLGIFGWMCSDEDIPHAWKMRHFVANKREYATALERWRRFWLTLKDFLLFDIRGR
jgi:mannan endo-1,6-alpha-mannosidase